MESLVGSGEIMVVCCPITPIGEETLHHTLMAGIDANKKRGEVMIRCYQLTTEGQELINRLREFERMSDIDRDSAQVLCQVKLELEDNDVLYYDSKEENIIPAFWIMRLESRELIKRNQVSELLYSVPVILENVEY